MGSDPQSYLQAQHERDVDAAMVDIRVRFPYAVYAGSEKLDLGPKVISALCQSKAQAEALIGKMWPGIGYFESIHDKCAKCGNPRGNHRPVRWAHHSECTTEQFVAVDADKPKCSACGGDGDGVVYSRVASQYPEGGMVTLQARCPACKGTGKKQNA